MGESASCWLYVGAEEQSSSYLFSWIHSECPSALQEKEYQSLWGKGWKICPFYTGSLLLTLVYVAAEQRNSYLNTCLDVGAIFSAILYCNKLGEWWWSFSVLGQCRLAGPKKEPLLTKCIRSMVYFRDTAFLINSVEPFLYLIRLWTHLNYCVDVITSHISGTFLRKHALIEGLFGFYFPF